MFLKRIEMQGFKSFADKTVISFDHGITGIVGPNGCGKSNITDAVRWVLGEQSAKNMRGEKMNDVIFAGSADRKKVNMAEVTLVFDNSRHSVNHDSDEVEVTRRLFRDSNEAEYLINRNHVRLKDVVDLFLDTGLGRDSLSIISQGNVISFAQAKPQERRGIFEEAAGVAKYKKRKLESLAKLERTKENLDRSQDILMELEKQVSPLKRAAHKAEIYRQKKQRLEEIEITVLVQDIEAIQQDIDEAKKSLFDIETKMTLFETNIQVSETKIDEQRKEMIHLDQEVNQLQDILFKTVNDIQSLTAQKAQLDEKRKYIIETGSDEERQKELRALVESAKEEYEDRQQRLDTLNTEMDLLKERLNQVAQSLVDKTSDFEQSQTRFRSLENRKNVLDSLMKNPFNNQQGIRVVMENQRSLQGILGVVGQLIQVTDGYEEAIATALGGAMNQIVTSDERAARQAIAFLTRNMSGRATFLPLTVCKPRYIRREDEIVLQNTKGYLGKASDFVNVDDRFIPVIQSLLNNVLVVDELANGNEISALTRRAYKIVTLQGEIIHSGGSMTGGKTRHNTNLVTMKKEADDLAVSLDGEGARLQLASRALESIRTQREQITRELQEKRYAIASLEPVVDVKKSKYEKLQNDLSLLNPHALTQMDEEPEDDLVAKLNAAYSSRDEVTQQIQSKRETRMQLNSSVERKEAQLRQTRKDLHVLQQQANGIKIEQSRLDTRLEACVQRLSSEYQLTYEFAKTKVSEEPIDNAREEVAQLRGDIERLGNINMNAPEEYAEVNDRYEQLKKNIDELVLSRDKILAAIDEMDGIMKKQFKEMFDAINSAFDEIFRALYGGGKARLILQDPTDLLNTGIDIDAQPPGKAVQNNMLFSGGEKSLIALCVLFAILKVKPVPLVILDEVEAALDPGNVERFASYLHHYTDQTQFIVVTHRVGTMEKTDVLFGVTMQKQGVSQMLKVELKDAISLADPSPGEQA